MSNWNCKIKYTVWPMPRDFANLHDKSCAGWIKKEELLFYEFKLIIFSI